MKRQTSHFDAKEISIYELQHAYCVPLDTVLAIAQEGTQSKAITFLQDKRKYTPLVIIEKIEGNAIPFVTPDGVLLLSDAWGNDALARLHGWLRRAVHRIATGAHTEEPTSDFSSLKAMEELPIHDDVDAETIKIIQGYETKYPWRQWVNLIVDLHILITGRARRRETILRDVEKTLTNVYGFVSTQARKEMVGDFSTAQNLPDFIELVGDDPQWRALTASLLLSKLHERNLPAEPPRRKTTRTLTELQSILQPLAAARGDDSPHHIATLRAVCVRMAKDGGVDWQRSETRYKNKYHVSTPSKTDLIIDSTTRWATFKRIVKEMLKEANENEPV